MEFKRPQRDAAVRQQRKVHAAINDLIHSRRRRYLAMNIVVAIASLLVVVTGIFGGMYIYKWVTYVSASLLSCPFSLPEICCGLHVEGSISPITSPVNTYF